jgi:hypothetical protein
VFLLVFGLYAFLHVPYYYILGISGFPSFKNSYMFRREKPYPLRDGTSRVARSRVKLCALCSCITSIPRLARLMISAQVLITRTWLSTTVSGTNIRVPVGQELKDTSLSPSKTIMSVVAAQSGPTERVSGSPDPSGVGSASPDPSGAGPAHPTLRVGAPARPTSRVRTPLRPTPRGRTYS